MNSSEFAMLKMRITARLRKEGVATSDILASELDVPHGTVRVVLEELSDEEVESGSAIAVWPMGSDGKRRESRLDASARSIYQSHPSVFTVTAAIALCMLPANPELR